MTYKKTTDKAPALIAYHVAEGKNAPWIKLGGAWHHEDGKGLNLVPDVAPMASPARTVPPPPNPKDEAGA